MSNNYSELISNKFEAKDIIIFGLGREGLSSYQFLRQYFPEKKLTLIDEKTLENLDSSWQKIKENDKNLEFETSFKNILKEDGGYISKNDVLIIKSPGISPQSQLMIEAQQIANSFESNTNIFFELIENLKLKFGAKIKTVGITGTKGKSTTTSTIYHVLKECGFHAFLAGNIGKPPLLLWNEIIALIENADLGNKQIIVVLEMSSHQLSILKHSPNISVILDISPEHLDYYKNFDEYVEAKSQISKLQTHSDLVIFDNQQEIPTKLANMGKAKQINFSFETNVSDNFITYNQEQIIDTKELNVIGKHNILNTIPSIIIAKEIGCDTNKIAESLKTFAPLPHRLEIVAKINGVTYINDSLSTTPKSCIAAIDSFNNQPIILVVGGYNRNLDYKELTDKLNISNIKHLILLPDTGETIAKSLNKNIKHSFAQNMQEAVETAKSVAESGDVVLLSPAAASFGHFIDYQDRGNQFKKFVG
ncbi:UDP-N-acetylmuramoyl-L-alanine--D-glutamate ligase [Candidatus Woesebacteria bacterium]|nr:UDP-N-acetylmuramoyl-L-alanine--D-glutamate ligase [Candidatus Woesebacteria bacterium]